MKREIVVGVLTAVLTSAIIYLGQAVWQLPFALSIPSGAVVSFESTECPSVGGWEVYRPAFGRFIRGIDPTGAVDPGGPRMPGTPQEDQLISHTHTRPVDMYDTGVSKPGNFAPAPGAGFGYGIGNPETGPPNGAAIGSEVRPKNVALLFCRKR